MNLISKIENAFSKNLSIATFINDDNILTVLRMAPKFMEANRVLEQLERKTCKVSLENRLHAIIETMSREFHEYMFPKNEFGERTINDVSNLTITFFQMLIKKHGLERTVDTIKEISCVSCDNILEFLLANGYEEDMQWYLDNTKLPIVLNDNCNQPKGCCIGSSSHFAELFTISGHFSIVLRKYSVSKE